VWQYTDKGDYRKCQKCHFCHLFLPLEAGDVPVPDRHLHRQFEAKNTGFCHRGNMCDSFLRQSKEPLDFG
jgi:hypothetical protein